VSSKDGARWTAAAARAAVVVLAVGLSARLVVWLLAPVLPYLIVAVVLITLYRLITERFR
jgi:fatty acid desaturase